MFPTLGRSFGGTASHRISHALGCKETETAGDLRHPGGTLPGFVVARSIPPVMLALLGEHRFARYGLVFRVDLLPGERCRVRAETRAEFPGIKGRLYRAAVVDSRGHVIVTRLLLRSLRRRVERRA